MSTSTAPAAMDQLTPELNTRPARGLDRTALVLLASPFLVIALWEIVARTELLVPSYILPPPSQIGSALVVLLTAYWFPEQLVATTEETLTGFVLGSTVGLLLGIAMAYIRLFQAIARPYVVTLQITPKVVLAPLFLTWFGFGLTSKIIMAATIAFFPVVINTVVGLQGVDRDGVLLMRSLVASPWQTFRSLAWPSALPAVFAGLKTALTLSLTGALVAEFVGAKVGLGSLIKTFSFQSETSLVFAVLILVSALGLGLYGLISLADARIVFWHRDQRA